MAKLLTEKPSNLTLYPNSFERQEATPLDANSLFFSFDAAQSYAINNPVAYVGQIITVIEDSSINVYVITNTSGELLSLINRASTGIQTFETYEAMQAALPTLTKGQIVTLVNTTTTEPYIVNYDCTSLVKIEGSVTPEELDESTIRSILDGTFVPDPIWPEETIQSSTIDSILNGGYQA